MNDEPKRVSGSLTPQENEKLQRQRALIANELPDLAQRDKMRKEAQDEATLSGEIRRTIHASGRSLSSIATQAGITLIQLDEFLTGERTLRSDTLDRVATAVGFRFQPAG